MNVEKLEKALLNKEDLGYRPLSREDKELSSIALYSCFVLYDGSTARGKVVDCRDDGWEVDDVIVSDKDKTFTDRVGKIFIHSEAVQTFFHVLSGGKNE